MAKNIKKLFALILAISMVMSLSVNTFAAYGQSVCDEEAHTHENACYALTCGKTEADLDLTCGMEAHKHTVDCHVHGEGCAEACALPPCEIEIHAHDDKCYTSHVHVEACYDFETLTCPLHVHGDECYTTWYGDEVELDVEEGTDGYTYMLFGDITDDGNKANDYYYYETSNHTLKKEVTTGGAVHLIALIDTAKYHGDWTPDGVYNCGESNFDVVYCCDAATGSEAGDYYKRLNLEDSEYFTAEEAKKLRAILANSYPFVSVEEAKAALEEAGFEQADKLDRSELISATQAAVWTIANKDSGDSYVYNKTASTPQKNTWGGYLHDFSNEHKNFTDSTSKVYTTPEGVGDRINALRDFLLDQDEVSPKRTQVVISNMEIVESVPVMEKEGIYTVALRAQLNNSGSSKRDDLEITIYVDGIKTKTVDVELGTEIYDLTVEAEAGATIKAVVSGTQILPEGVYFYAPKPEDLDGDGIATSREVSQNLIGVSGGTTPIHAEAEVTLPADETTPVTGALALQKTDEYGESLTGAEFALYVVGETSTMYVDTYAVDENGQLTVEGLLPGDYELEETVVPEGYLEPDGVFTFSINAEGTLVGDDVADGVMTVVNEQPKYTVTYEYIGSIQPENPSELPATESYPCGKIVTVAEDATAEGYVFSGWSETGTFAMPAEDVVITGSWDVASTPMVPKFAYEVRYFLEELDGSYEEVTADFYRAFDELGATVSPAEKAYEHYVLNTELSDAQGTVIAPSVVNGELNILRMNVYFDREEYTVTYEYTGSVQPEDPSELPAAETYKFGETVTVAEDATAEGYVFSGWSKTGTFEMPAEDVVITGSWKVASTPMVPKFAYEVRYFLEELDGSYEEVTADFYRAFDELGATVSPAEKAYEHYVLNTELSDAQGTVIAPSVVNGELNILRMNVYFDREEYTVTYKYTGSVQAEDPSELPATETYKFGETVTVAEDATAEGYVFSGWSKTGTFEMPAEDVVITGSWKVVTSQFVPKFAYEVRYFLEELDGSYEEVTADFYRAFDELGATVSPAEKAYEHYVLNTELSDAQGTVIAPSVVNGELNILRMNVYFDREEYTVTYEYTGSVQPEDPSELPAAKTYKYGETVTVAEDATAEGYVFSGWSKTGTFEMPAEDVVITGSWKVAASQFVPKFAYEVRYFQEQRDGSYEEVTADFYRAFDELGATVSPAEKAYEHYVLNTELSDAQGTVIAPSVVDGELNILRMNVYFDLVRYTVTYIDRGEVVQFTEELVSGDEIPDCEDPETYFDKHHKYNFQNWILVEGEEGEDSTIGTTNLVYESVYKRSNKPNPTPPSDSDDDPDVEILDDEVPLAEIPALFGDDHYAYIIGYTDGLVHPEANITRAEVATIFFRLLDEEIRNTLMTDINDFPDVEKGQWYNHAVSTLSSMGIVLGRNDGNFYPNDFITRAEFAAIAARFDPSGNPEGVFFSDIAGHWAEREIIIAANNGWVEGYNGLFRPDDYITRAEAMTLVNRVLHRLPETEHDLLEYMVIWPDNMNVDAWYYLAVQEATNSHDYIRKTDPIYESWTEFIEPYDWSLLEY